MYLKMKDKIVKLKQFVDEKIMSKSIIRIGLLIVLILSLNTLSYAYFNAQVVGKGKQMVMTTSNMRISFTDSQNINQKGMIPGDTITKTFTVTNEAESSVEYKINWEYLINNFVNKQYLVYTVTSTNNGGNLTQSQVPDSEEHINILNNITIGSGVTQEYTLTVTYLDSGSAQDEDKNKSLIGKIEVTDLDGNSILPETSTGPSSSSVPLDRNLYGLTVRNLMNEIYPVGSIYTSVSSDNPSAKFGGTWVPYGEGKALMGYKATDTSFDTVEKTGGTKEINLAHTHTVNSHTHSVTAQTLTAAQIPAHTHPITNVTVQPTDTNDYFLTTAASGDGVTRRSVASGSDITNVLRSSSGAVYRRNGRADGTASANTGGGGSHNHGGVTGTAAPDTNSKLSSTQSILNPYITVYMWKRTA